MSRLLKLSVLLVIFLIGIALHLRNDQLVSFNYYLGSIDMPLSFFLVLTMILGALLGVIACLPWVLALKRENVRLAKQATQAEHEINSLRVLPARDVA